MRIASFADDEGFLGYAMSWRFHFNGIGFDSTLADVEAAFPAERFSRENLKDLTVFGEYWLPATGPTVPNYGT